MNGPEKNYEAWLAKAEHDLLNIENNLAAQVPWDTVCFHAQQAAEKLFRPAVGLLYGLTQRTLSRTLAL
jgi:HEPN domain-containing protein